ncbi:MAG: hemerythrin domain-containing protein [Chloroflexi bacterium]|nr:hemerythrin domain-containing protein [Chloroflexota bacterium]
MKIVDTLWTEHNAVQLVLAQARRAAAETERGVPVPADIFADVQEFFAIFVDRCHHGKEEAEIFPRLAAGSTAALIQRMEADHATGRRLAAAYADAVRAYRPGDAATGQRLAEAVRAYAAFLSDHIDLETQELFPAIEQQLADQDHAIAEAFEGIEINRIGPGTHERLHGMIDSLGPRIAPWMPKG